VTGDRQRPDRPLVVVAHGDRSIPPLQLAEAAAEVCDLIWLVHGGDPEITAMIRLLRRLGPVIDVDGLGPDQIAEAVAPYRPEGAAIFRDDDIELIADVAERLGLPFHRPAVARRLVDKVAQRRALRAGGLPMPSWWEIPSRRDEARVGAVAAQATYPAVLKPVEGSGSWHTYRIDNAFELVAVLDRLNGEERDDEAMVVEEYLTSTPGAEDCPFADYVSVETVGTAKGLRHVAVTGRLPPAEPFRETGLFLPSALDADQTASVLRTATAALAALEVRDGCLHTEIKLTPDGPRVIEVNGRIGGGVRDMLQSAAGVDMARWQLQAALGRPVDVDGLVPCDRIGYHFYYQAPVTARRFLSIGGLAALGALPGVDAVDLHLSPGESIDPSHGSRGFVLSLVGWASDHEGVATTHDLMYERSDIAYDHEGR
jgi:biotin carboxylase